MVIKYLGTASRFLKMGSPSLTDLVAEAKAAKDVITLEVTVVTGFEPLAMDECREKCKPVSCFRGNGRIFMNIKKDSFPSVLKLRSVDNVFLVNEAFNDVGFTRCKEEDLDKIKGLVDKVDWTKSVPLWAEIVGFKGVKFPECAPTPGIQTECGFKCQRCLHPDGIPQVSGVAPAEPTNEESNPILDEEETTDAKSNRTLISVDADSLSENASESVSDKEPQMLGSNENSCDSQAFPSLISSSKRETKEDESDDDAFYSAPDDDLAERVSEVDLNYDNQQKTDVKSDDCNAILGALGSDEIQKESVNTSGLIDETNSKVQLCTNESGSFVDPETVSAVEKSCAEIPEKPQETRREMIKRKYKEKQQERRHRKKKAKEPKAARKPYVDDGILKFRVTCYRNGKHHSFDSNDAAGHFGGTINDAFHWTVDLTRFDINVFLVIEDSSAYVTYGLTKSSLHLRNISHFGPTTLRSTMCYSLMRMAEPRTGDIVIDPLCGGASISIEGAHGFPRTFQLCGDHNDKAMVRSADNIKHNRKNGPLNVDAVMWDATSLPLRDQSVDVLVTDLPFGLRIGRAKDNRPFYKAVLLELGRVVRCSGRAVLLTYDKEALIQAIRANSHIWREISKRRVNHGGLSCFAVLLLRKSVDGGAETAHKYSNAALACDSKMEQKEISTQFEEATKLDDRPLPSALKQDFFTSSSATESEVSTGAKKTETD